MSFMLCIGQIVCQILSWVVYSYQNIKCAKEKWHTELNFLASMAELGIIQKLVLLFILFTKARTKITSNVF